MKVLKLTFIRKGEIMNKKKKICYVWHGCKNPKCNNGWMDLDLTNAKTNMPRWKYCEDCCEKYGFVNPETPPKKKLSEKQKETLNKYKFTRREKPPILPLDDADDTTEGK